MSLRTFALRLVRAALIAMSLLLAGCATTERRPAVLTGNILVDGPAMIASGPPEDKVLWQYRTAAAAMRQGQFHYAKELLDDALLTVGGISTDKSARLARTYFHPEATKNFIGEPYERVMAYFYRGILYWMDGEPDNARACFRSAQIQDADAENRQYAADYAILDYLDGLVTTKLGGDGSDAFERAEKVSKLSKLPPYDPDANVLFLIEFGNGPVKYATGEHGERLRFRERPSPIRTAALNVNGQELVVGACDDLQYQATTRGGRVMDYVLGNKAVFKSTTAAIGDIGIMSGAILAGTQRGRNSVADEVGIGLLAAGVLSHLFSAAATPAADTRSWDNLPRYISFAYLQLPPGEHTVTVEFRDASNAALPSLARTVNLTVPEQDKDKVVFVSDKSTSPITL